MIIKIEDRVVQALRHLQPDDAKKVNNVLSELNDKTFAELRTDSNIHKLTGIKEQVFVLRATSQLRILCKHRKDQSLLIEDIVSHKGLEKFLDRRNK